MLTGGRDEEDVRLYKARAGLRWVQTDACAPCCREGWRERAADSLVVRTATKLSTTLSRPKTHGGPRNGGERPGIGAIAAVGT